MSIRKMVPVVAGVAMTVLVGLGVAVAADGPAQTVRVEGLKFEVPAGWKSETPKTAMRKVQYKVPVVTGDDESPVFYVSPFRNGAGTVEANIARWSGEFRDGEQNTPKAKVEKKKGSNVDVTRIEVAGRYVAGMPGMPGPGANKPNFRLLGAIVETKDTAYFFKMVGPDKTMNASAKAFDDMIASMTLDK